MKWILFATILLLIVIFLIFIHFRKKWAIRKVACDTDEEKLYAINAILCPFGFEFDLEQDIVISKNDAWQRDLGYSDLYDLNAPLINIVMHAEPIYFDYNQKHYRLEFWKGQYGITTGAEIGLYVRDFDSDLPKGVYRCATDDERLIMQFHLFKQCYMFSREDLSWWLTGFDVGNFSSPQDLKMDASIKFPNKEMQTAFISGLLRAGYAENKIDICCDRVCFEYCCPHHYKLNHCHKISKCIAQFFNCINCALFRHITRYFNLTIDKLDYLRYLAPCLYRLVIRMSIPQRKYKKRKSNKIKSAKF